MSGQPPAENPYWNQQQQQPPPQYQGQGYQQPYQAQPGYQQYQQKPYQQQPYQQQPYQQPQQYGGYQQAPVQPQYTQPVYQQPQAQPYVSQDVGYKTSKDGMREPLTADNGERFREDNPCRDMLWAIAFVIQLVAMIGVSAYYYSKGGSKAVSGGSSTNFVNGKFWGLLTIVFVVGFLVAVMWIALMRQFSHCLIWFALYLNLGMWVAVGVVSLVAGQMFGAIIAFLIAGLTALWMWCVKDRIAFASAMIEVAIGAIMQMPSNFLLPPLSAIMQVIWTAVWVMGLSFVIYDGQANNGGKINSGLLFIFVLSFYWTSQVIANVVLVTIMGSVATWYFMFPDETPPKPVYSSFKRASTTSFGSICFGSFIVALLQAIRFMVNQAAERDHPFLRACADCILGCLEDMMNYFNMYAYAQVAIYGKTYCNAAKDTWDLFMSKGFDAIINDDLVHMVFWLTSLVSAAVTGGVALLVALIVLGKSNQIMLWGLIGALVGFVLTLCVTIVIGAGVKVIFVCFAEDPAILSEKKPGVYSQIETAWRARYGKLPAQLVGS